MAVAAVVVLTAAPADATAPTAAPAADPEAAAAVRSAAPPRAADEVESKDEVTPLTVVLSSMSPPQIPRRGAISLTGAVTNSSQESWEEVNVVPFVSAAPITTRDELAAAAATASDEAVGERLTDTGTYASLGDLAPGERSSFSIRVPVTSLPISGDPGVYWIGVHALGADATGRDLLADGRVRTFIPLVDRAAARRKATVSIVLPLRERARRADDGSLAGPRRWAALTAPGGRLTRVVDFGASAGAADLSWIIDPAVLDALEDYGRGDPPLSLGSARREQGPDNVPGKDPTKEPSAQPDDPSSDRPADQPGNQGDASESATPSPSSSASAFPERADAPSRSERARATDVLQTFLATARDDDLLTLGYADVDAAALARRAPSLLRRANDLSTRSMTSRELNGRPVVAPPEGRFDPDLLRAVPRGSLMVLSDEGRLESPVSSTLPSGPELLLGDERAAAGGPSPTAGDDPLALRQRILSEAALEVSKGAEPPRPVVVLIPPRWDPGPRWRRADFFGALDTVPWISLGPLPRDPATTYDGQLSYTRAQETAEVGTRNVAATRTLVRTGTLLGQLLANENTVEDRLAGAALQASSYGARPAPRRAAAKVLALDATTRSRLSRVQVTGTDFVTLSGGSGSLTVTLVNGLKQPVTVGLRARTDDPDVQVKAPDPVEMQAAERTTLRLQIASGVGVHDVTLYPVTTAGKEIGTPLTFSLRTSRVGRLIWYIISAGGILLAVMIARRIVLRVRNNRWREEVTE